MAALPPLSLPPKPSRNPNPRSLAGFRRTGLCYCGDSSRRATISLVSIALSLSLGSASTDSLLASAETAPTRKVVLSGISNTRSWFQFFGDGFSIRVPPQFEDTMEPEDYNAGLSLYGDKVKPKTFAARFASSDGSEVLSVVTRPTNQLKITFLEAKDITDLGSLKQAAKLFVPGGADIYSARTIKIKEDENIRTYYFYEFGIEGQHVALVSVVNSGKVRRSLLSPREGWSSPPISEYCKQACMGPGETGGTSRLVEILALFSLQAYIAGATAPEVKWEDDGVKLRSAAISLSVL